MALKPRKLLMTKRKVELNDLDYQHPQQMVEEQRKVAPHQLIPKWRPRKKVEPKDLVSLSIKNE